jgi:hypothetical protein
MAQAEVHHRGEVACRAAMLTWNVFWEVLTVELKSVREVDDEVQGDGPVGGITACANACLPHLLRQAAPSKESMDLFSAIAQGVQEICASRSRMVRAFAAETLHTLHVALMEVVASRGPVDLRLESIVVDHFFRVSQLKLVGYSG